jgi:hypothetical protein
MKTSRCVLISCAAIAVLAGGLWLFWPHTPATAINPENAARIAPGMSVQEVETILGGAARDEVRTAGHRLLIQSVRPDLEWNSDAATVWVHLDQDGRVRECQVIPVPAPHGVLGTMRRWLGL